MFTPYLKRIRTKWFKRSFVDLRVKRKNIYGTNYNFGFRMSSELSTLMICLVVLICVKKKNNKS